MAAGDLSRVRAAPEARRRHVRFLAYNSRVLILPWVQVEHLASHILGRMALRISADWQRIYGHPIYFLDVCGSGTIPGNLLPCGQLGCGWERRRDEVNNRIATRRTGRSKMFWDIH
jgi:hypothetical protein